MNTVTSLIIPESSCLIIAIRLALSLSSRYVDHELNDTWSTFITSIRTFSESCKFWTSLLSLSDLATYTNQSARTMVAPLLDDLLSGEQSDGDGPEPSARKLKTYLNKKMASGVFNNVQRKFVPEGVVQEVLQRQVVKKALGVEDPTAEHIELIDYIMDGAQKTFAVAVMAEINANRAMRWFKYNSMKDCDLPIREEQSEQWQDSWHFDFYNKQWEVFVPVFSTTRSSHDLEEAQIIPFVKKIREIGHGSFGVVSQYAIHKAHMDMGVVSVLERTQSAVG
jgi:hypothetical protein